VLGSDAGEYALMDVREILFNPVASAEEAAPEEGTESGGG
jgi:type VI secretion system protein ImpE